jgi:hypothetical protein
MRRCFLHIGTHKTGTTSIQHVLSRSGSALAEKGYFYPRSGRLEELPGHHNLAWEISGDRRFRQNAGTSDDLIREVKDESADIILSSEDFGASLDHEARFSAFISLLESSGFRVTIIVYLRNQIDFLPRVYLTLLHAGWDLSWRESQMKIDHKKLLRRVRENDRLPQAYRILLDSGSALTRRKSILDADYCDMLRRARENANVELIVRSYDQARTSICGDFLSIFNLALSDLHPGGEVWMNASLPVREYLLLFLRNRLGRELLENEKTAVNALVPSEAKEIALSPAARLDLFRRFSYDNRTLSVQYGIPEPEMGDISEVKDSPDAPYIDQLFSENIASIL